MLTYGHSPRPLEHDIVFRLKVCKPLPVHQEMETVGVSSGEQGLRNKLRERIGLLERFIYCKIQPLADES